MSHRSSPARPSMASFTLSPITSARLSGFDLDASDEERRAQLEPDVAIDARIGEIIDAPAEGRNIRIFAAVDLDRNQVVALDQQPRQSCLERRVAVRMGDDRPTVETDDG